MNGLFRSREVRGLRGNRVAVLAAAAVVALTLGAVAAHMLAPYSFATQHADAINASPGPRFALGADGLGRDILSRLLYGARISLAVGLLSQVLVLGIGVPLGLIAGYFRGRVDWTIMTLVNVMLTFPFVLLALAVIAVLGPNLVNMIAVLGIAGWPIYTRVVRAETLAIREREFVLAGQALGMSHARIVFRCPHPPSRSPASSPPRSC